MEITLEEQKKLRNACLPLMQLNNIECCKHLLDKFIDSYLVIMKQHHYDPVSTQSEADNRIWFQMMMSKALNIKNVLDGIEYDNGTAYLNRIIDPTILLTLVRNLFEAICAFEIVTIIPDTQEKKLILYNLYCISGFGFRQRFFSPDLPEKYKLKLLDEKEYIQELITEIKNTELYKSLRDKERSKLDNAIKGKNYQISINSENQVKSYGWGDIPPLFGIKPMFYKNIYTYFCLNAHPSHISMIQFRDMFKPGEEEYIRISVTTMKFCFMLLSIYLSDYIKLFPQIKNTYENFPVEDQILLNFHNKLSRGDEYSISDKWKMLG